MKNPQVARRVIRLAVRMAKSPAVIIQYLIARFGASQEEAEATLKWAEEKEKKK